jgi:formylglycine-generating enzyme
MKRRVFLVVGLALAVCIPASQGQWKMRVHEGEFVTEFWVSHVDSLTFYEDTTGVPGMITLPAGTFTMGSPEEEYGHQNHETQREVVLTTPFHMSLSEVTNQQFVDLAQWAYERGYCTVSGSSLRDALDGSTEELLDMDGIGSEISFSGGVFSVQPGKEEHPVFNVSWYGAVAYCDWLSLQRDLPRAYDHATWLCNGHDPYNAPGYRLPTEAEWEYACRAGTQSPFNTGSCLDAGTEANYDGNQPYPDCPPGPHEGWTVPVGSYPANGFDLHDMHGNLWEWCNDWYGGGYGGDETDPVGPLTGSGRIVRGGSWVNSAQNCRSAVRSSSVPENIAISCGLRPVRSAI